VEIEGTRRRPAFLGQVPIAGQNQDGTPPYWGEWGVVGTGGSIRDSGSVGPFRDIRTAFNAAAKAAGDHGATALPQDGFAQVRDSKGQSVGPIT
jgi:hypothetical protein